MVQIVIDKFFNYFRKRILQYWHLRICPSSLSVVKIFSDSQLSPKHDRHRPRNKKMDTVDERDTVSFDFELPFSGKVIS